MSWNADGHKRQPSDCCAASDATLMAPTSRTSSAPSTAALMACHIPNCILRLFITGSLLTIVSASDMFSSVAQLETVFQMELQVADRLRVYLQQARRGGGGGDIVDQ